MSEMKTIQFPNDSEPREIVDAKAREELKGKLSNAALDEAIRIALAQAKESGEFDGAKGEDGKDYILTEADKAEIAEQAKAAVEPLIGTTEEITPLQVKEALEAGKSITLTYTDAGFGTLKFNSFSYAQDFGEVYSSTIVNYGVEDRLCVMAKGVVWSGQWLVYGHIFANKQDIPTDEHINELIDGKLSAIGIAEEGAY